MAARSRMRSMRPRQRSVDRPISEENHPMHLAYIDARRKTETRAHAGNAVAAKSDER